MIIFAALVFAQAGVARQAANVAASPESVPVFTMTGDKSRVPGPRVVVCGDQKQFDEFWSRHTGQPAKVYYSESPAPTIDFKRYMAVLIFEGARSNSQGIRFLSVQDRPASVLLRYQGCPFQTLGPDGGGVQVEPWGLAVLARSSKPVVIEENLNPRTGEAPNWHFRAKVSLLGPSDSYAELKRTWEVVPPKPEKKQ